jgi:uncharacterized phiE125 gp8 family phage protein
MAAVAGRTTLVVPPTEEPVALAEAKAQLRVDTDHDDALIARAIAAARGLVERWTNRALVHQVRALHLNRFPSRGAIQLAGGFVTAVQSITFVDYRDVQHTLSPPLYRLFSPDASVIPDGGVWPVMVRGEAGDVVVIYHCGWPTPAEVPAELAMAVLMLVGHFYANREGTNIGNLVSELPLGVRDLVAPFRVPSVA